MLTLAWRFDFEGQAEHAMVLLQQAAAARGAGGNADPLLHPLLPGGADGEAGRRGAGPGGTGRRRGGSPDGESIKRRLSKALLLLLTEGAPQRRGPGGTRARRVHGVAPA